MPRKPSSPSFATTASGIQPSSSHFAAWGASSARAKSRAVSRIMRCSSVRKSPRARGASTLLRVFLDAVDVLRSLLVDVGFQRLRLVERLDLGPERVVARALERLGLLRLRVDLGGRG